MPITNKPSPSPFQVGQVVYYYKTIEQPGKAKITKTDSFVTDVDNNDTAEQKNIYYLEGENNRKFYDGEIFLDAQLIQENFDDKVNDL